MRLLGTDAAGKRFELNGVDIASALAAVVRRFYGQARPATYRTRAGFHEFDVRLIPGQRVFIRSKTLRGAFLKLVAHASDKARPVPRDPVPPTPRELARRIRRFARP